MLKRTTGEKVFAVFNYTGMVLLSLIFLIPVWHVLMGSLSDPLQISAHSGIILYPLGETTLGGYGLVMQNNSIVRSYGNTLLIVVSATALGTFLTILASYVMSVRGLYWKKPINFLVTFTMIFNGGLIPTYMVVRNLNMLDTYWCLIIPGCCVAYNIIIMRTSFSQIPDALSEAATIDGAGHFRILFQIILPVSKAIIAVIVLFYAIQQWNAWFNASIYLQNRDLYPLQLTLREIVLQSSENSIVANADGETVDIYRPLIKYCSIMVSIIPMMIVYPFVQKYFVTGVMIGSVKG
ncbi:MAG TPA: carbohydrate ABC transporter permease [Candidatus Faecivivens stercoripullorum]|uniref:Carbohydrate ABC transporter permease n=1 Tax=Candidatus Faecivivens stercoripullorum TaxID=2840805 RepID=A0A9D1H7K2_9FIRM|nr:carbohydrate ABC transporter permease [Candidatus Faecivivens stercoripullorum]